MQKYRLISKKGEGTFSEVLKAQSIKTGKYVAIKCMKNHFESIEQVSIVDLVLKSIPAGQWYFSSHAYIFSQKALLEWTLPI